MTPKDISETLQILNISLDKIKTGILNPDGDKEAAWVRQHNDQKAWDGASYANYYSGKIQNCASLIKDVIADVDALDKCKQLEIIS